MDRDPMDRDPMDRDRLKAVVSAEIRAAIGGVTGGDGTREREQALDYYLGKPYGDERPGRSQVVSREVADTIEWIMPSLLRIFTAGDEVVRFEPHGPDDVAAAEQATDYVNWIFNHDNPGFLTLYTWFKDALLQRIGVVKVAWEVGAEVETESYQGLTEEEMVLLLADKDELEVAGHAAAPGPDGALRHDLVVRRRRSYGRVVMRPVPPEEFLVSRRARAMDDEVPFAGHRVRRTQSELIAAGYPPEVIDGLPDAGGGDSPEELTRYGNRMPPGSEPVSDRSMRLIEVVECYLRVDADGDGVAELRKITMGGGAEGEILDDEPVDAVPFAVLSPILMPHKLEGLSVADLVMDLQRIKSTLMRQMLDGLYMVTNPPTEVVERNVISMDEVLHRRIGGVIRVKEPGAVRDLTTEWVGAQAFPMLEYLDRQAEGRTGVSRAMQGLDVDTLTKGAMATATGASQVANAAQARVELIARVFAETGVRRLFRLILRLVTKYQQKERIVRLRNQWVPMDPRGWRTGRDTTIAVGLGTGNRMEQLQFLREIMAAQRELMQAGGLGMVGAKQLYNTLSKLAMLSGLGTSDPYFMDPAAAPPAPAEGGDRPPPQASPEARLMAEVEQAKTAQRQTEAQAKLALERELAQARLASDERIRMAELRLKYGELQIKAAHDKAIHDKAIHDKAIQDVGMTR
jgi:hypothetical protein